MAKIGWISLHREVQKHWLWDDKPFSKGQAWIDLLLLANHKENKFLLGNELVEVEEGSFITSELKLMERWGWGKAKTRAFLDLLQMDNMIIKKADRKKTTITIVNYSKFQELQTTSRPQTDRKQTTNRPQTDRKQTQTIMINNDNNENNDNKKEKALFLFNTLICDFNFSDYIKTKLTEWVLYKAERKDEYTEQGLKALLSRVKNNCTKYGETKVGELIEECMSANYKGIIFDRLKNAKTETESGEAHWYDKCSFDLEAYQRMLDKEFDPPETVADNEDLKARAERLKKEIAEKY